ncbi:unnamed protein product [Coregonus sp. 'balchen']|nr:unnamed protein product [Coregonus sp. 'balchen']
MANCRDPWLPWVTVRHEYIGQKAYQVPHSAAVRDVKQLIYEETDLPVIEQQLVHNGKVLYDKVQIGTLVPTGSPEVCMTLEGSGLKGGGMALYVYNDAVFTTEDWNGIQEIARSRKREDPLKVGRFGIGFNSVYHITDVPSIFSGEQIGMLDPHQTLFGANESGQCWNLKTDMKEITELTDQFAPYIGLFGNSGKTIKDGSFSGTLFRFPLRIKPSQLSANIYNKEKVLELFESFKADADTVLLFLKSVQKVSLHVRESDGTERKLFQVTAGENPEDKLERPNSLKTLGLATDSYSNGVPSGTVTCATYQVNIETQDETAKETQRTTWLVCNGVGGRGLCSDLDSLADDLKFIPTIGIALPLTRIDEDKGATSGFLGRAFCFLPLPPGEESLTGLPVHVSGFFGLTDNRRSIKWREVDQWRDPAALWNELLIVTVIPRAYFTLIMEAIKRILTKKDEDFPLSPRDTYRAWPDPNRIKPRWKPILEPLFHDLLQQQVIYSLTNSWIQVDEAVFSELDTDVDITETVISYLQSSGMQVARVPGAVDAVLNMYVTGPASVKKVTPPLVRQVIRKTKHKGSSQEKLLLLEFVLSDNGYSDLIGLELLPLQDETFSAFSSSVSDKDAVYIASEEYPRSLYPGLEGRFILEGIKPSVMSSLKDAAKSRDPSKLAMKPIHECTYCDIKVEDLHDLLDDTSEPIILVHDDIPMKTAEWLNVPCLSTRLINPENLGFEQSGQREPLTVRIKNILEEYPSVADIFKELLQNADDASATECSFLIDMRKNIDIRENLLDPGMIICHGPSLWSFNNSTFSDTDFLNITRLGGSMKRCEADKVGKFGLGFNSVYHITDIPIIMSREFMIMFDPNINHISKHIRDRSNPGIKINWSKQQKRLRKFPNQFKPFINVFNCQLPLAQESPYKYDGTLFRLPFRTEQEASVSEISSVYYNTPDIYSLVDEFSICGHRLILFTQHVGSMVLKYLKYEEPNPAAAQDVVTINKSVWSSKAAYGPLSILKSAAKVMKKVAATNRVPADTPKSGCIIRIVVEEFHNVFKRIVDLQSPLFRGSEEDPSSYFEMAAKDGKNRRLTDEMPQKAVDLTNWLICSCMDVTEALKFSLGESGKRLGLVPCGGVAVLLSEEENRKWTVKANTNHTNPIGEVFCYLPLRIKTGLPVHINGCFAVTSNRKEIWKTDTKGHWNSVFMRHVIVQAYLAALNMLRSMAESGELLDYSYYVAWPDPSVVHDDFTLISQGVYQEIAKGRDGDHAKVFSDGKTWVSIKYVRFLDDSLLCRSDIGTAAFKIFLKYLKKSGSQDLCAVELPEWVKEGFDDAGCKEKLIENTLTEKQFFLDENITNACYKYLHEEMLQDAKAKTQINEELKTFCSILVENTYVEPSKVAFYQNFDAAPYLYQLPNKYRNSCYSARRNLWRDDNGVGVRSDWNNNLMTSLIAPAYVELLIQLKRQYFPGPDPTMTVLQGTPIHIVKDTLRKFLYFFPVNRLDIQPDWYCLVKAVYTCIHADLKRLLPVVRAPHIDNTDMHSAIYISWVNTSSANKGHAFFDNLLQDELQHLKNTEYNISSRKSVAENVFRLKALLSDVGFNLVHSCDETASLYFCLDDAGIPVSYVTPEDVRTFLLTFSSPDTSCQVGKLPCRLQQSNYMLFHSLKLLVDYCFKDVGDEINIEGLPLLMTMDNILQVFDSKKPKFLSTHHELVSSRKELFMNTLYMKYNNILMNSGVAKVFDISSFGELLSSVLPREYRTRIPVKWRDSYASESWLKGAWHFISENIAVKEEQAGIKPKF